MFPIRFHLPNPGPVASPHDNSGNPLCFKSATLTHIIRADLFYLRAALKQTLAKLDRQAFEFFGKATAVAFFQLAGVPSRPAWTGQLTFQRRSSTQRLSLTSFVHRLAVPCAM